MQTRLFSTLTLLMLLATPLGVTANSPLTTVAKAIFNPPPDYPEAAVADDIEGVVQVRLDVEATGQPSNFSAENDDVNPILLAAAIESLQQWHFAPATRDGQPVSSSVTIRVRFELKENRYHNGSVLGPTAPWAR